MPCYSQKFAVGTAVAGMVACGVATIPAAPTVIGEVAVWAAFVAAAYAYYAAMLSLAECLEDAGRHSDAETLRREVDQLKREMEQLGQHAPQ